MTDDHPTADGHIEKSPGGSTTVRFDRRLRHPIERVWQALTDPEELRRRWGDTKLDPVEGGLFQLRWRNTVDTPAHDIPTAAGWHLHLDALAAVLSRAEVDITHPEPAFTPSTRRTPRTTDPPPTGRRRTGSRLTGRRGLTGGSVPGAFREADRSRLAGPGRGDSC
jgi:hypothetical protein